MTSIGHAPCNLDPRNDITSLSTVCACGHKRYEHALFATGFMCLKCGPAAGAEEVTLDRGPRP